jgi:polyisoprenoid-binding protein YceI
MRKMLRLFVLATGLLMAGRLYAADVYAIDPSHSSIAFAAKHLMVSTTSGAFNEYEGTITYDPKDLSTFKSDVTIQAKSIDTHVAKRDDHLRGADFFDVEKFPTITFVGKSLASAGEEGKYILTGDLTLKGVTKEVSFPVTIAGPIKSPMGGDNVIGLEGQLTINRQDYGVTWNKAMDNGGFVVSNDIPISISIEANNK